MSDCELVYWWLLFIMNDITALCSLVTPIDQRNAIVSNIIVQYDLHFSVEDMIKVFEYFTKVMAYDAHTLLFLLLTTNVRMFIAIAYAALDDDTRLHQGRLASYQWYRCLICWHWDHDYIRFTLGQRNNRSCDVVAKIYCILHDYYEFDITNLMLSEEARELIQKHIDSQVSNVKRAIKK